MLRLAAVACMVWMLDACTSNNAGSLVQANDCADVQRAGVTSSTVVRVTMPGCISGCAKQVLCDFTTVGGGWTVIQQRQSDSVSFFETWDAYKQGFGLVSDTGNHWAGNEYVSRLTSASNYEMFVNVVTTSNQEVIARYNGFRLSPESSNYILQLGAPTVNPSSTDNFASARNRPFGTLDRDTDTDPSVTCGAYWHSGWWFETRCASQSDLNVPFTMFDNRFPHLTGIQWNYQGSILTLKNTKIMIRPSGFARRRFY